MTDERTGERHVQPRIIAHVDLIERDKTVLDQVLAILHESGDTWRQNYLIRRIINRWVSLYLSGQDIGVLPEGYRWPESGEGPAQQREAQ